MAALSVVQRPLGQQDRDAAARAPQAESVARSSEFAATPPESASARMPSRAWTASTRSSERRHDRALEGREQVDELRRRGASGSSGEPSIAALLELAEHRRLQAREGEVARAVADAPDREADSGRRARARRCGRSTGPPG